jgi:hypothetical protein
MTRIGVATFVRFMLGLLTGWSYEFRSTEIKKEGREERTGCRLLRPLPVTLRRRLRLTQACPGSSHETTRAHDSKV